MFTFKDYMPNRIGFNNYEDSERLDMGASDGVWDWMVDTTRFGRIGEVREDIKTIHNEDGELIGTLMPIELRYNSLSSPCGFRSKVTGYILWNSSYRNLTARVNRRATEAESVCPTDITGTRSCGPTRHSRLTATYDQHGLYHHTLFSGRLAKINAFVQTIIVPERFIYNNRAFYDYLYSEHPAHNALVPQMHADVEENETLAPKTYGLGHKAPADFNESVDGRQRIVRQYAKLVSGDSAGARAWPSNSTSFRIESITNGGFNRNIHGQSSIHVNYTPIGKSGFNSFGAHMTNRSTLAKTSVTLEEAMAVATKRLSGKIKNAPHRFRPLTASLKPKKVRSATPEVASEPAPPPQGGTGPREEYIIWPTDSATTTSNPVSDAINDAIDFRF